MNISNSYVEGARTKQITELSGNLTQLLNQTYRNLPEVYRQQALLSNLFEIAYHGPMVPTYVGVICQFDKDCN